MRVLWLSHKAELGGAELSLSEGVRALIVRGHDVHVVLPRRGPIERRIPADATLHVQPYNPWTTHRRQRATAVRWVAHDLARAVPRLARLARQVRADVLITNTLTIPAGGFAARLAGIPHVWYLSEYGEEDHGLTFLLGRRRTLRLMNRLTDLSMVNSESLRAHFGPALQGTPVRVVRYAVDVPDSIPKVDHDISTFRILVLGQKSEGKGQTDAIEASARLVTEGVDVRVDLVGGGDPEYNRRLEDLVVARGLRERVRLIPFVEDPFAQIARSDVLLMCSRAEAFGRVTIEAMKVGTPVIGSAAGGTRELIRDGWNGRLYPSGDVAALTACIAAVHRDPELAQLMAMRARAWARANFNLETHGFDLDAALTAATDATVVHGRM